MFPNTAQTQRKVLHSISHSEFYCVEYIDGNRVYNGRLAIHHKNHLHILETAPASLLRLYANLQVQFQECVDDSYDV